MHSGIESDRLSDEGAWFVCAGAGTEVLEGVEAVLDARDRDAEFSIGRVVGSDRVTGNGTAWNERAEGIGYDFDHRALLVIGCDGDVGPASRRGRAKRTRLIGTERGNASAESRAVISRW
jgi:hypothetical protein